MAIQHFVFSKFKPGADQAKAFAAARAITPTIPGVKNFKAGPPLSGALAQGYGFAMTAEFDDLAAFQGYLAHPDHIKLVKTLGPLTEKGMLSYQIDTSATPTPKL
ncbi:hypothetical protein PLICRDRAFT_32678 [Plicaturopsis crispa FD-325 SS-3]|uniref:Unplaced genomic scaffold PLICRscaffold_20, whole genome shotgun sequence n=1 Tax=Plicaturopsis crispa FD-325 SS-3 TaxID=944288 RepID=A0A0C9SWW6_PLICR|nr:hypothetical protein PLICRDRAFT_32678 [Plicaturopsis crispa FD-325 SS-3]